MDTQVKPKDLHKIATEAYKLIQSKVATESYIPEVVNILQDKIRTIRHLSRVERGFGSEEFP